MPTHENLAAALAAFQAELPKLRKDETAKVKGETQDGRPVNYSYGYADLAQVVETISPVLGKHGLSFSSTPTVSSSGAFGLAYVLLHEGGDKVDGWWPLPNPMQVKPQQIGSAITYARRYALMAVTNTFPDKEDDDGAGAFAANHRDQAMSPEAFDNLPKERPQAAETKPPKKTAWTDDEVLDQHAKLTQLPLEQAGKLYDWMAAKDLHNRPVGASGRNATLILSLRLADTALLPETTLGELAEMKTFADGRGLLKVKVSTTEVLEEVLFGAGELARHAADQAGTGGA